MNKISDEDKDKIIEAFLNGVPVTDTAKEIGRSKSGIYHIINEEGLSKEDFGRNLTTRMTLTEEEEEKTTVSKSKLSSTDTLFKVFKLAGIDNNDNMQILFMLETLSKIRNMNITDYVREILIPLMLENLESGINLNSININEFLTKKRNPDERLHNLYINEAIEDFEKKKKGELPPEPISPEEELKLFELKKRIYLKKKDDERVNKIGMIMSIFPPEKQFPKLIEYAISNNDSELMKQIGTAYKMLNKGEFLKKRGVVNV